MFKKHPAIISFVALLLESLSVDISLDRHPALAVTNATMLEVLARSLPKMKRLSELRLSCRANRRFGFSEESKRAFVHAVERRTNLTTITLEDPANHFTPAQHQTLRTCAHRNAMLPELIRASIKLHTPAPPGIPRVLTTCHNCPNAALALLVSLKDKVGPRQSQKRTQKGEYFYEEEYFSDCQTF